MKHSIIRSALIASALLLFANLSLAADTKPGAPGESKTTGNAKAASPKEKKAAAQAAAKLVDINSAKKAELKTLPGIGDEEADKIIAARPFGSKAHLVTQNIISLEAYQGLKSLVIAKQKQTVTAKPSK